MKYFDWNLKLGLQYIVTAIYEQFPNARSRKKKNVYSDIKHTAV